MQPMKRIVEQYREAKTIIDPEKVIYIALQGSQNYNLEYKDSDIDSKVIVTPDLRDVVENRKPVSTTHVCDNDEHIDLKDIRLMFDCFKKQNINFIEILFTDYHIIQSNYYKEVIELRDNAEDIARYNPYRAVKCIKGMAKEKFHALKHPYPSKEYEIKTFGYDPKQLSHIIRLEEFLKKYIKGISYKECLITNQREFILNIKKGKYDLIKAEDMANKYLYTIEVIADDFCNSISEESNKKIEELLDNIKYKIMTKAFKAAILNK